MPRSRDDKPFVVRRPAQHTPRPKRKRASGPGAVRRKRSSASQKKTTARPASVIWSGLRNDPAKLPDWKELSADDARESRATRGRDFLESVPTTRFLLWLFAVLLGAVMYVGHVHATQQLVAELEQARQQNLQLHLQHSRLKGDFDRITGPAVIHERAQALGLRRGAGAAGPPITVPAQP